MNIVVIGRDHVAKSWAALLNKHGHKATLCSEDQLQRTPLDEYHMVLDCSTLTLEDRKSIHSDICARLKEDVIICLSGWQYLPSQIMLNNVKRSRCVGIHAVYPPNVKTCVEICPMIDTDPEIKDQVMSLMTSLGLVSVMLKKEVSAYISGRLEIALMVECLSLMQNNIVSASDIDKCMIHGIGLRYALLGGPFSVEHLTTEKGLSETIRSYKHIMSAISGDMVKCVHLDKDSSEEIKNMLAVKSPEVSIRNRQDWLDTAVRALGDLKK